MREVSVRMMKQYYGMVFVQKQRIGTRLRYHKAFSDDLFMSELAKVVEKDGTHAILRNKAPLERTEGDTRLPFSVQGCRIQI